MATSAKAQTQAEKMLSVGLETPAKPLATEETSAANPCDWVDVGCVCLAQTPLVSVRWS